MPTVKENLIAAKALIDTPEKWGKGHYRSADGCLCAYGAVMVARGMSPGDIDAGGEGVTDEDWALARALPTKWGRGALGGVVAFNDHPDTSHADIMALFQRAIDAQDGEP